MRRASWIGLGLGVRVGSRSMRGVMRRASWIGVGVGVRGRQQVDEEERVLVRGRVIGVGLGLGVVQQEIDEE